MKIIAGVDEAGRGPLAGPVYAAAVIMPSTMHIEGVKDSKKLSSLQRDKLFDQIIHHATSHAIGSASVEEIDQYNILQATFLAMHRAVLALNITPDEILIDGNKIPPQLKTFSVQAIIDGDALVPEISMASILAKVARDREMKKLHEFFPHYGFKQHKGYGTKMHIEALKQFGACPHHRKSFAPVRNLICEE